METINVRASKHPTRAIIFWVIDKLLNHFITVRLTFHVTCHKIWLQKCLNLLGIKAFK
ncbi:Uncharacterised protein [Vibrio cholerae]|nr:Uncharacterised protein [Vibrio cholerae]